MADDLFSTAACFLPSIKTRLNSKRLRLIKELEHLLASSPFLTKGEKEKMRKVIPMFTDQIIQNLKNTLIRQNLRTLHKIIKTKPK